MILPKMSGYIKTFKYKGGNKNTNKKIMSEKNIKPFGLRLKA